MARYVEAIQYRADIAEVKAKLAELRRETRSTQDATERDTSAMAGHWHRVGGAIGAVSRLAVTGAALLGAAGVAMGGFGIAVAASTEQAEIGFTTLLGSGERAKAFLGELQQFAASTPFEFPQLRDAASRLLAVGATTEQVIPLMRALGDATSAMGTGAEGIDRAVTALTQMQQKGKVTGEEMLQLAEAGIPAWDALASKLGVDVATAQDMVSKGQVKVNDLFAALEERAGPAMQRVAGMMEQQSQSLLGLWSTLKDVVTLGLGDMMGPAVESIKAALPDLTTTIQGALEAIGPHMTTLATGVVEVVQGILPALVPIVGQIAGLFGHAFSLIGPIVESLAPFITRLTDQLAPLIRGVLDALLPALGALLPPIISVATALGGALTPIVQALAPIIQALADRLGGFIQRLANTGILERVGQVLGRILDAVAPLAEAFGDLVIQVLDALMPLLDPLARLFEQVADALVQIMPELEPVIAQLGEAMVEALAALVPSLIPLIDSLAEVLVALVPIIPPLVELNTLWVQLLPPVAEVAAFFAGPLAAAIHGIAVVIDVVVRAVGGLIDAVINALSALPGAIGGFAGSVASAAAALGGAIISGIRDGASAYFGFMGDIAQAVLGAFKEGWNEVARRINDFIPDEVGFDTPFGFVGVDLPDNPIPRFHSGGVAPDEMLAVLRRDEVVFTPDQMEALGNVIALAMARRPQIGAVHVQTNEPARSWYDESLWRVA